MTLYGYVWSGASVGFCLTESREQSSPFLAETVEIKTLIDIIIAKHCLIKLN